MEKKSIYSKPVIFSIVAAVAVLIGTFVTMFLPMFTEQMHPKLINLKPYTALQLAGRDIYQREGCVNCHTQTVRPLKAEVLRYGDYSKAGEFAYDRPFLWGSKRTGPDLARIGGKYPDEWHYQHLANPQAFFPQSNMPKYDFLANRKIDAKEVEKHMKALGFPYSKKEIEQLKDMTEMDALVAYLQTIGTAVAKKNIVTFDESMVEETSPLAGVPDAIKEGKKLYMRECAGCHGQNAEGNIGGSLRDYAEAEMPDKDTFLTVANGIEEAMPGFANKLTKKQIWSLVEFIKSLKPKN
ncbi:cytochrome-c oxidase, cbb3-type subunit II [Deferribacter autotrophicus]|uniref:Cytochrome-c oxidase, cbb3-type subunit II n=1 Tax=Deferribacter autotrophicus TaxID=500465 RepID=A0A5A8F695_9BACT|nr:cytochrome-c oxidase, cbb3-type subunit II [Deferribacter autotrophicus]KAA0257138.1 cytochrome-c oxidase, cbb3-type subunit II [Deferribacter autotrophicus]